jgi:predicted transcriptional regulator
MTVLTRLAEKGVLERTPAGRGFVYSPAVVDEAAIAVRFVVTDYGEAALAHFVDHAKADPKLYRRLRRLLEEDGR